TNFLRLWTAVAAEEFDLDAFQVGEYWRAVDEKIRSENITKVLYPNDASTAGKQLRLEQEYFFVSCALQDCIRLLLQRTTIDKFADQFAIQLNGTHPALAIPELMRLLMDEHGLGWDEAWSIASYSFNYTGFVALANPRLSSLITEAIGDGWLTDLDRLAGLERLVTDAGFRERWRVVKQANKERLAGWIHDTMDRALDPLSLFDAQCKRIHEYKRQQLNLLHVAWLYQRILRGDVAGIAPRTFIFSGKAAPAYHMAKLTIRLATALGETLARHPVAKDLLSVVFVPDFNVKNAQRI